MGRFAFPQLTLEVENKGSTARDHLANERTFLAWLRTSSTTITVGVAVTQLFRLGRLIHPELVTEANEDRQKTEAMVGKILGGAFIVLSIVTLVLGVVRYFTTQRSLLNGWFTASRTMIVFTTFIPVALFVCLLALIIQSPTA
ncbi:hypothetical protein H4R34_003113 [Dimargaris verticillata]|uniref:DUF202 domain-containing protein n=1 Tax=Dimargaris verticillata TaxID=2761393 RepID=A0A9W8B1A8_9FUNG|nr:hypothetical protein H4R34_003113 [Dimargaris verticillata]